MDCLKRHYLSRKLLRRYRSPLTVVLTRMGRASLSEDRGFCFDNRIASSPTRAIAAGDTAELHDDDRSGLVRCC
jgi:hypothetical protein